MTKPNPTRKRLGDLLGDALKAATPKRIRAHGGVKKPAKAKPSRPEDGSQSAPKPLDPHQAALEGVKAVHAKGAKPMFGGAS